MISPGSLPQLAGRPFITDGGIETDLIFHAGLKLPDFAAFVLLDDPPGREALRTYYRRYVAIAEAHGVGLILDTPTWRANFDWGARLGYSREQLAAVNRRGVALVRELDERAGGIRRLWSAAASGPGTPGFMPAGT